MKDKILDLLGANVPPVSVAQAVGCEESYISQLLAEEEFYKQVLEKRAVRASKQVKHDGSIDEAEESALRMVRRNVESGLLKPMEAVKHFAVLNSARRRSDVGMTNSQPTNVVVNLNLPAAAVIQFKLSVNKEVIEVDGRSMTPLQSKEVARLSHEKKNADATRLLEAPAIELTPMQARTQALLQEI